MINLTSTEILRSLDLPAVEAAILQDDSGKSNLLAYDFEDVKAMCWAAAEKWLLSDLNTLVAHSLGVEESFQIQVDGYPVKGVMDLRGEYKAGADKGAVVIADWKSSTGELDLVWQNRLIDSKQWRLYATVPPGADFISYRGVNPKGKTREVYINVKNLPNLQEDVDLYFGGVGRSIEALAGRNFWPQNKPHACGAFASTCPHKSDDSCDPARAPRYTIPVEDISLSYSGAQRFLLCPEKYRRSRSADIAVDDGSEASRTGVATHRGLEEIWKQAFKLYGE